MSEDLVGIYECLQGLSSDTLMCYTKDILVRCSMDGHKMAAMGFDGFIMFANIQKSYIDMVEVEKIAKEFAEKNEKRIKYFGKYHA